jgi:hypothetical protein
MNGQMGGSSSPLAWLPVNRNGQTHLVEAWVKNGLLTLALWSPDGESNDTLAGEPRG